MRYIILSLTALILTYTPAQAVECVFIKEPYLSPPGDKDVEEICDSLRVIDPKDWREYHKSDCEKLNSTGLKNACFFVLAKRDMNPKLCYGVIFDEPVQSGDIQGSMWNVEKRDEAYCSFELWSEYEFDRIKTPPASEFCFSLSSAIPDQRDKCLKLSARNEKDPLVCLDASNQLKVSDCLGDSEALDKESWWIDNMSVCEQLTENIAGDWKFSWRSKCLSMHAHQKRAVELCDPIADLPWRDSWGWWGNWFQCVLDLAENEGNPDLCDHVSNFEPPSGYPRHVYSAEGCRVKVKTGKIPIRNTAR